MADEDLATTIEENAQGPAAAAQDGTSVTRHSLRDQIEADKYLLGRTARVDPRKAVTRLILVPPGAP